MGSSFDKIGLVIQILIVFLALGIIYSGQIAGVLLLVPAVLVDCFIKGPKRETIGNSVKLLLLFQGIMVWIVINAQSSSNIIFGEQLDTIADKTKNIVDSPTIDTIVADALPLQSSFHNESPRIFQQLENEINSRSIQMAEKMDTNSIVAISKLFSGALLPAVNFPDLKYRPNLEVKQKMHRVFTELPSEGYLQGYKNPCWHYETKDYPFERVPFTQDIHGHQMGLACLPYAYVLGMPKCGTSDLYERLKRHNDIRMPIRKEVRWFTRGEFMRAPMQLEGPNDLDGRGALSADSSLYSFTRHFDGALNAIAANPDKIITIDGGPHTLWWPTQSPDGTFLPDEIPPAQMIREMQPHAKFLITINDPVKRMFSDYYFLMDNMKPIRPDEKDETKSSQQFHQRSELQVSQFRQCVQERSTEMQRTGAAKVVDGEEQGLTARDYEEGGVGWFRASQMCAHDRHKFGLAGWGRICIGLYVLFIEKFMEHFPPDQFLVVRLEDYESDPRGYMTRIFNFLQLDEPNDWAQVTSSHHANEHGAARDPILPETEALLREFHRPYNELLAKLLNDDKFRWEVSPGTSLHDKQSRESQPQHTEDGGSGARLRELLPHGIDHIPNALDQHGAHRFLEHPIHDEHGQVHSSVKDNKALQKLRGFQGGDVVLKPESFSLDGLPVPKSDDITWWLKSTGIIDPERPTMDKVQIGRQLAYAVFSLDLAAVKYILYDVGIPADTLNSEDMDRTAFHSLAFIGTLAEGHGKSYVYNLLKGKVGWLAEHLDPALATKINSIHSLDIIDSLHGAVDDVAKWLLRAGVPVDNPDRGKSSPLHYAAYFGLKNLVRTLLENGANPNRKNLDGRTPLHFAASIGRAEIVGMLMEHGGNIDLEDNWHATPRAMISNPGPILPEDAVRYLNITQRPVRDIGRIIHPEQHPEDPLRGWQGTGGWGPERLTGYENDMRCDLDQYWADEITGEEVFYKYIAHNSPVLIRGLIADWPVVKKYGRDLLQKQHGELNVQVSDIPYAVKYGGAGSTDMTLGAYIDQVHEHKLIGGRHPWYVFKGHPIPMMSDEEDSLVALQDCPTPDVITKAFEFLNPATMKGNKGIESRKMFVNAQWALGGEGTGAPVHYHNTAWNALIFGAKKWAIYPPHHQIMSNRQILEFFEKDMKDFDARHVGAHTCVQTAGDVMIIPESWGHGVLNIQEAVAVATESRQAHWRVRPGTNLINSLPNDNNANMDRKPKHRAH